MARLSLHGLIEIIYIFLLTKLNSSQFIRITPSVSKSRNSAGIGIFNEMVKKKLKKVYSSGA
jgi:hypothetical protein